MIIYLYKKKLFFVDVPARVFTRLVDLSRLDWAMTRLGTTITLYFRKTENKIEKRV
jgi:hypothetical protein